MSRSAIPLAGVVGASVEHSRSPQLFRHWLHEAGLQGYYVPLNIALDALAESIKALPGLGFVGVNVTIPYKEIVIGAHEFAAGFDVRISDRAALIGAANMLTFRDRTIYIDNSDGYGFLEYLHSQAPDWRAGNGPALVLGAGGAARAVVATLIYEGVPEVIVANRTRVRAEQIQNAFGNRVAVVDWLSAAKLLGEVTIAINATSLGMAGKQEMRLPLDELRAGTVAYDLVYTPLETPFLKAAAQRGCTTVDGLGMLLHQAVPGFERWFGIRPQVDARARAALVGR